MAITDGITSGNLPGVPATLSADINQRQPSNSSYLHPTAFRFYISRVPSVTYFCQAINIPSIDIAEIEFTTTMATHKEIAGNPTYGALTARVLVDEDMETWRGIHDWMREISLFENDREIIGDEDHRCDLRLVVLTNGMNGNVEFTFKQCFPSSISEVNFDSAVTDLENLSFEVTFSYNSYSVEKY